MKKGAIDPVISILMAATIAVSAFSFSASYTSADIDTYSEPEQFEISVLQQETDEDFAVITEAYAESEETTEEETAAPSEVTFIETEGEEAEEIITEATEEAEAAETDEITEETEVETEAFLEEAAGTEVEETEPEQTEAEETTAAAQTTATAAAEPEVEMTAPTAAETTVVETTAETTAETTPEPTPAPVTVVYPAAGTVGYDILVLVNNARAAEGLSPLSWSDGLAAASAVRASEITVVFDHTRPDGSSCYTASDLIWAENIACGQASAQEVFDAWMNSPCHRANIMAPDYTTMGVALCNNGDGVYNYYWAQEFGY